MPKLQVWMSKYTKLESSQSPHTSAKAMLLATVAAISSRQWGDDMASAEREPIRGVWVRSPQRGPGAEPLVLSLIHISEPTRPY